MLKYRSIFAVLLAIAAGFVIVSECEKFNYGRTPDKPFKCKSLTLYWLNYCKYCRCVLDVLVCGPDIQCSGQKYWRARYCHQTQSWKEYCNTCQCTLYGTVCTVKECPPAPETTTPEIDPITDVDTTGTDPTGTDTIATTTDWPSTTQI